MIFFLLATLFWLIWLNTWVPIAVLVYDLLVWISFLHYDIKNKDDPQKSFGHNILVTIFAPELVAWIGLMILKGCIEDWLDPLHA